MKLSELIEIAEQDIKDLEDAKKSKLKESSLYTTNFIGPLSYQAFSFLKLLALS